MARFTKDPTPSLAAVISTSLRGKLGEQSHPFRRDLSTTAILQLISERVTRKQITLELNTAVGTISKRLHARVLEAKKMGAL
jgi:DNA-binding NarL/FixJ family response regulator